MLKLDMGIRVQINLRYDERGDADSSFKDPRNKSRPRSFRPRWLAKTNEVRLDVGG